MTNKENKDRAKKALKKLAGQKAKTTMKDLGMDKNALAKTLGLAAVLASGKIRGRVKITDDLSLEGELEPKKKKVSVKGKLDF